ncbi:1-deoxy-D-xylulose-5-phosphate synthase [Bienertia sinuspersici]
MRQLLRGRTGVLLKNSSLELLVLSSWALDLYFYFYQQGPFGWRRGKGMVLGMGMEENGMIIP